jgi:murein DD-endopeptidase MepM/ murein hydrolase activator NlpD
LRRIFNNQPRGRHSGVDLKAGMGEPIKSSNRGKIVLARNLFFAGNCVIIDHGLDIFSIYCHLSKISVQEGETVEKEQIIGLAGATGRVTGPHLHWSIKVGGVNIAPFSLLYLNLE